MGFEVKDFNNDVINQSRIIPVLVDFWAEWCGPCRVLSPILEKLAEKYKGRFKFVKVNTDENQEIAIKYGIRGIPNVKLFINGDVADEFMGALPEQTVEQWLKKTLPPINANELSRIRDLIRNGNSDEASVLIEEQLKEDPANPELKLLLAQTILFNDHKRAENLILESEHNTDNPELAESLKTMAHLFSLNGIDGGDAVNDYKTAIAELKNRNFDTALEKFIEVIKTDRTIDDDGARKSCIAIFKFLGEENEITLRHRRDFGSALYI